MTTATDDLIAELRAWTANHDDHVRAAVELLIEHDYWLRNGRFVRAAVVKAEDGRYIQWYKAREAFDAGEFDRSSSSERAVLDLAISLGEDRFKLTQLGRVNRRLVASKVAAAMGLEYKPEADKPQYFLFRPPNEPVQVIKLAYPDYFDYDPACFVNEVVYDDLAIAHQEARRLNTEN